VKFLNRTPVRTFFVYPLLTLLWEFFPGRDQVEIEPMFLPLMLWGYLQYHLCGLYRMKHGGGGPGPDKPPEHLVSTGPYAYTRNPMYLGHLIFLLGLTLTLTSWLAALITLGVAPWFHLRVLHDERRLVKRLGKPYVDYMHSVKRWIPGLL